MSLIFDNSRFTYFISHDLGYSDFNEDICENLDELLIFNQKPILEFKKLSNLIYDEEFIKIISPTPILKLDLSKNFYFLECFEEFFDNQIKDLTKEEIKEKKLIYNSFKKITLNLSFDLGGIITARIDFFSEFSTQIKTKGLINLLCEMCDFIDKIVFPNHIKNQLEKIYTPMNSSYLKIHETYSMVSSINILSSDKNTVKSEISGIVWKDADYDDFDEKIVEKITKNDIGIYKRDIFTIATPAALLICEGKKLSLDHDYLEERINSVEIFCRQQHLLKKLDVKLDELISRYSIQNANLKPILEEIRSTKIDINSLLEFYRNTKIHAIDSFIILFDILNDVFGLNKQYFSVKEKLDVCEDLYISEYERSRSKITEKIQKTIVVLGSLSLIVAILNLVKTLFLQIILFEIIIASVLIILIKKPGFLRDYVFLD